MDDWRPYRGNVFMTKVRDEEGLIAEKDTLGRIQWRPLTEEEAKIDVILDMLIIKII